MKTKITVLSVMLMIAYTSILASVPGPDDTKMRANETIRMSIDYPEFAIEKGLEGIVWVRVEVRDDGSVNILQANSCCDELLSYVVGRIGSMDFDPAMYETCCTYNLKFTFNLL